MLRPTAADIDRLDAHIDKMLEPGQDKGKEERIIRAGYATLIGTVMIRQYLSNSSPAKVGLAEYMASLKRVERALSQMTTTNLRANQQAIGDFNELLSEGSNRLQDLFRDALSDNDRPVEPLHFITKGELCVELHVRYGANICQNCHFLSSYKTSHRI